MHRRRAETAVGSRGDGGEQCCTCIELGTEFWLQIHSGVDASLCITTPPGVAPSGQALVLGSCSSLADQTMLVSPTGQIKLGESGPCVTVDQGVVRPDPLIATVD